MRLPISALLAAAALASAQTPPPREFRVNYTGRLLGYVRSPDRIELRRTGPGAYEPVSRDTCPDLDRDGSEAAKTLRRMLSAQPPGAVLVGMGDNFAPDLAGRVFRVQGEEKLLPKDTVSWSRRDGKWLDATGGGAPSAADEEDELGGRSEILTDNTACGLKQLGYRAIVAGKHDFYYGPERLRQLARFLTKTADAKQREQWRPNMKMPAGKELADPVVCADCGRVDLLGANLAIAAARVNAPAPLPDYLKKLDYAVEAPGMAVDTPAVALPWLRSFRVSGARRLFLMPGKRRVTGDEFDAQARVERVSGSTLIMKDGMAVEVEEQASKVRLCNAAADNPDQVDAANCVALTTPSLDKLAGKSPSGSYDAVLPPSFLLTPGRNYAVCVDVKGLEKPFCTRFTVHHPYLQYPFKPGAANPADHASFLYADTPAPYVVVKERNLAIFGVVDPDLKESIGPSNYTWISSPNQRRPEETAIVFADPAASLRQLLALCDLDPACQGANKVLLAQMAAEEAALLNRSLGKPFQLVIAQTDARYASGQETRTLTLASESDKPAFLAIPRPMYEPGMPGRIDIRLQSAHVRQDPGNALAWTQSLAAASETRSIDLRKNDLRKRLEHYAAANQWDSTEWTTTALFQRTVLDIMRSRFQADVAVLQERDLFQPGEEILRGSDVTDAQSVLDRIVWKGDFVSRVPVTGTVLKAAAAKSKAFAAQERNVLNVEFETGRPLIFLGMVEDRARKQWLIRGEPVDDARLYSAVMSDYLAYGETGYADFRKPAVPPGDPLSSLDKMRPLSPLVCQALVPKDMPKPACRAYEYDAASFLDWSSLRPPNADAGLTPLRRFAFWIDNSRKEAGVGPLSKPSTPGSEKRTQNQAHWGLALERADFGFLDYNNGFPSEDALAANFSGVPNSQVQAPNSSNLNAGYRLRGVRSSGWGDFYALGEGSYNRVFTRRSVGRLQDQRANTVALEGGVNQRLWPRFKQVPDLKAILAVRYQSQFARPILSFALADGTIRRAIERASAVSTRFGGRYQSRRSWIEGGYQAGAALNTPIAYRIGEAAACRATGIGSGNVLADCLKLRTAGDIDVEYRGSLFQHGFFLAYRVAVPLPFGEDRFYVQENRGDFYFHRTPDTPIDTRLFNTWTHSLILPIRGNFSLVPKLDFFLFASKQPVAGRWFTGRQASMGLQYRFEWREGLPWGKALKYPNPAR